MNDVEIPRYSASDVVAALPLKGKAIENVSYLVVGPGKHGPYPLAIANHISSSCGKCLEDCMQQIDLIDIHPPFFGWKGRQGKQKLRKKVLRGNVLNLPTDWTEKYDVVAAGLVINNLLTSYKVRALDEIHRVLKPEGYLIGDVLYSRIEELADEYGKIKKEGEQATSRFMANSMILFYYFEYLYKALFEVCEFEEVWTRKGYNKDFRRSGADTNLIQFFVNKKTDEGLTPMQNVIRRSLLDDTFKEEFTKNWIENMLFGTLADLPNID